MTKTVTLHDSVREFAQGVFDDFGTAVLDIHIVWRDDHTVDEIKYTVDTVEIRTLSKW